MNGHGGRKPDIAMLPVLDFIFVIFGAAMDPGNQTMPWAGWKDLLDHFDGLGVRAGLNGSKLGC